MKVLEKRKADLKKRIASLREELQPHAAKVEKLREQIVSLEADLRDVYDEERAAEKQARIAAEALKPPSRKKWIRC